MAPKLYMRAAAKAKAGAKPPVAQSCITKSYQPHPMAAWQYPMDKVECDLISLGYSASIPEVTKAFVKKYWSDPIVRGKGIHTKGVQILGFQLEKMQNAIDASGCWQNRTWILFSYEEPSGCYKFVRTVNKYMAIFQSMRREYIIPREYIIRRFHLTRNEVADSCVRQDDRKIIRKIRRKFHIGDIMDNRMNI